MTADEIGFSQVGALVGETVGSYRITDVIGQGGMGVVYRAEHVLLGKRAAVKVLLPERSTNREMVDRFFNEAKSATLIEDPGIVDIFDFGRLPDGNAYIVMELLEGETLGDRLKRVEKLSPSHAAAIARHIAGTLAAAHDNGIIHRDLKPDNIFLVKDAALPRGERAKLLDFGIAKLAGTQPSDMVKTETGRLMGTPYYMSPEQCRGAGKIDHRTDLYSLGCVLYQMLTGRPPFVLEGAGEILAAHIHVPPLPPRHHQPSVPPALQAVVLRMLQKEPVRRYQSAADVVTALNTAVQRSSSIEDAPEPSLRRSGIYHSQTGPSVRTSSTPAFTNATTVNSTGGDMSDWREIQLPVTGSARVRRYWPWVVGALVAALTGALVTMIATAVSENQARQAARKPHPDTAGAQAIKEVPAPRPAPPPAPVPEKKAEPTPPEKDPIVRALAASEEQTVRLLVSSHPEGATVYRESDGVRLGKTPLEVRARRGRGEAVFILRRNGFRAERLAVPVDKDQERLVALRPQRASVPSRTRGVPVPLPTETRPDSGTAPAGAEDPADAEPTEVPDSGKPAGDSGKTDTGKPAEDTKSRGKDDALDPFNRLRARKDAGAGKGGDKGSAEEKKDAVGGEVQEQSAGAEGDQRAPAEKE
jgi:serine/threonine protein kinase